MKKKIISTVIFFLFSLNFIECIEPIKVISEVKKFIGVWQTNHTEINTTIEFFSNVSISITAMELTEFGTYELKGEMLILNTGYEGDESFYYKFSSDGKILTLGKADSNTEVDYIKQ